MSFEYVKAQQSPRRYRCKYFCNRDLLKLQSDINNWFRIKQGTTKFELEEQISSSDDGLFICSIFYSEADYGQERIPPFLGIQQPGFEPQPPQPSDSGRPNWT